MVTVQLEGTTKILGGTYFLVQLSAIDNTPRNLDIPASVQALITKYDHIFQSPKGLPHPRVQDHFTIDG